MTRPNAHSGYLNYSPNMNDEVVRAIAARDGSKRLLDALLRYYERRAAA